MQNFALGWLGLAIDVSIKSMLLAGVAGVALLALRLRDTNLRHRVWTAVLIGMLAMPGLVYITPAVPLPGWLARAIPAKVARAPAKAHSELPGARGFTSDLVATPPANLSAPETTSAALVPTSGGSTDPSFDGIEIAGQPSAGAELVSWLRMFAAMIYFAVAIALITRLAAGLVLTRRLVGRANEIHPATLAAVRPRKAVRLLETDVLCVPVTVGFVRPVVLLPACWRQWSQAKREAVLAHELAHVLRADWLVITLARLNQAVYWFHPVAWFLKRRLAELSEQNCDDAVLEATGERTQYARYLLEVAASVASGSRFRTPLTGVAMARRANVETRIDAILDSKRPLARRISRVAMIGLVVIGIPAALLAAALQTATDDKQSPQQAEQGAAAEHQPPVDLSKEYALREQSMNNLKHLALAMLNHDSAHKRFPPAAIRDKDGKPLLSWRVAILPFLEEGGWQLYQQFHLDEPWDSEHNKALIAKMPAVFRDPHEDARSTSASYFMPTGKGTFGDDEKGRKDAAIKDGTSNTIMLVEAKRDIPWTKPEDIEIDADPAKPLPKFAGHTLGYFAAAFADGSVNLISDQADPKWLPKFFLVDTGEVKPDAALEGPVNAKPSAPPSTDKPDAGSPQSSSETIPLKIDVHTVGNGLYIQLNGSRVSEESLRNKLATLPEAARNVFEVTFGSSEDVPYEDVARLIDLINRAGIHKITIPGLVSKIHESRPVSWPWALLVDVPRDGQWLLSRDEQSAVMRLLNSMPRESSDLDRQLKAAGDDQAKREAVQARIAALNERISAELAKALIPDHLARLKQLDLQLHGVNALVVPEVQEALGFDEVQKGRITIVLADFARQQDSLFAGPGRLVQGLSILDFQKKAAEQAAERDRKIDAILTDEQKAKLAEMKGKRIYTPQRGERNPWTAPDSQSPAARQSDAPADPVKTSATGQPDSSPLAQATPNPTRPDAPAAEVHVAPPGPAPKDKQAQALLAMWRTSARSNGDIPGGLVGRLADKVNEFIRNNTGDASGDPYAKKMAPLATRLDASHDWKARDIVSLLDDIAVVTAIPLETTMDEAAQTTIRSGAPLPPELATAPWGEPNTEGLREARPLDPQAQSYPVGTALRSRILLHNAGKVPLLLRSTSWMQPGYEARDGLGNSLEMTSVFWTTLGQMQTWRLAPGEFCEIATPGLGVGKNAGSDEWADVRVGSWIDVADGVDVTLLPAKMHTLVEDDRGMPATGLELKRQVIRERLERELPLPASDSDRELIVRRVIRDIFGGEPTPDEISALVTDKSDDPLTAFARRLLRREGLAGFVGELTPGKIFFRTTPADPQAANRPKVAIGPGRYTLDEHTRLIIVGRPVEGRRTSDVEIRFWAAEPNADPPGKPYKIEVPDGFGTWAMTCRPGTRILWVLTKGAARRIDYSNPAQVKETTIKPGTGEDMPNEFRDAVGRILSIYNISAADRDALISR
jgi:beta-lactamase regulating signal transducer with metallopeptidase domain/biopolymer transport protein ExbD